MPERLTEELCACGRPLHYHDPRMREYVESMIQKLGPNIRVRKLGGHGRVWLVPRHYIALHGLRAEELESLGFPEAFDA